MSWISAQVFLERHRPLCPVLRVLPLAAHRLDVGVRDFAEGGLQSRGRNGGGLPCGASLGERVGLIDDDALAQFHVLGAGLDERDLGVGADGELALPAAHTVAIDPIGLVAAERAEEEPRAVAVAAGLFKKPLETRVGQFHGSPFDFAAFRQTGHCPRFCPRPRPA